MSIDIDQELYMTISFTRISYLESSTNFTSTVNPLIHNKYFLNGNVALFLSIGMPYPLIRINRHSSQTP